MTCSRPNASTALRRRCVRRPETRWPVLLRTQSCGLRCGGVVDQQQDELGPPFSDVSTLAMLGLARRGLALAVLSVIHLLGGLAPQFRSDIKPFSQRSRVEAAAVSDSASEVHSSAEIVALTRIPRRSTMVRASLPSRQPGRFCGHLLAKPLPRWIQDVKVGRHGWPGDALRALRCRGAFRHRGRVSAIAGRPVHFCMRLEPRRRRGLKSPPPWTCQKPSRSRISSPGGRLRFLRRPRRLPLPGPSTRVPTVSSIHRYD